MISDLYRKIRIVKKYGYIRLVPECGGILKKRFFFGGYIGIRRELGISGELYRAAYHIGTRIMT